jgi:hypothetical protein
VAPFGTHEGHAGCWSHRKCARHWRVCKGCGSVAGRTLEISDPLRKTEAEALAKQLEREQLARSAQLPLHVPPGAK